MTEKHEPKWTSRTGRLRVFQWNADGINPKLPEMTSFLSRERIDIALIQESKLLKDKRTPRVEGYTAVRADRPDAQFPGGGLITYIKHDIAF